MSSWTMASPRPAPPSRSRAGGAGNWGSAECGEQCGERGLLACHVRARGAQRAQYRVDLVVDLGPLGPVLWFQARLSLVPLGFEVSDAGGGPGLVARVEQAQGVLGDRPERRDVSQRRDRCWLASARRGPSTAEWDG